MRHILALFVLGLVFTSGCASYTPSVAPIPKAGAMPAWLVEGPVAVGADPYVLPARQAAVFDGDLNEKGVLPIQVLVQNQGDRPLVVRGSDMLLVLADGRQISSAGATVVAAKLEETSFNIGAVMAFGIIGGLVAESAADQADADRRADYKSKKFHDMTIGKGESTHGFVYFIPPAGTPAFTEATLRVHCIDAETATGLVVNLPLTRLAFKGLPEKTQEETTSKGDPEATQLEEEESM